MRAVSPPLASPAWPLLAALTVLNGATVSTLYWAQSVAGQALAEFGPSPALTLMPSAALMGYAVGVALLAGLARDLCNPGGLGLHALVLGASLCAVAVAPTAPTAALACLAAGLGCCLTQRVLVCAASAVPEASRAPVIGGIVASGLIGIVLARAFVPVASAAFGWRMMFVLDAALVCSAGLVAAMAAHQFGAPWRKPGTSPMQSALMLWRREPVLRRAAVQQGVVFAAFNFGWALFPRWLAVHAAGEMAPKAIVAGLGAVAALLAGPACLRWRPTDVAAAGVGAVAVAAIGAWASDGGASYAAMMLLDVGTQMALVANQTRAQALATSPAMRGRLAAIVTTIGFAAGALGAAAGNAFH